MRRLVLLVLATVTLNTAVSADNDLTNGDFEDGLALKKAGTTLTVNAENAGKWWFGEDPYGWILQSAPTFASQGLTCAGYINGEGRSGGLLQFVPVTNEDTVNLSFDYLLWFGNLGLTTMDYAVFGFTKDDTIRLENFINGGPGGVAVKLFGDSLASPQYPGDDNPGAAYMEWSDSGSFDPTAFQYIGVWFQYEINGGSFYVDRVCLDVTAAPEPATVGLLSLGGLVLFLQRRRRVQ